MFGGADVGAFSQDDFDVYQWINKVLEDKPTEASLDAHISAVSMKLQIISADLNDDLERSMADLLATLPRAVSDADRVSDLTRALADDLERIDNRLVKVEGATSSQVLVLEKLDLLKQNLETCGETLTEAANWSALVRDVHASFGSSQLRRVATQLEAMQRSEKVLRNVPGSAERTSTLTQLRSQLETLLRPQLLALLSKTPLCRAAELEPVVSMYRQLGKMDACQADYTAARPAQLHRTWFAYQPNPSLLGGNHDSDSGSALVGWLPMFYDQVLSVLQEERRRASEVFGANDGSKVVVGVGTAVFEPIVASFAQRLAEGTFSFRRCEQLWVRTLSFAAQALALLSPGFQVHPNTSSSSSRHSGSFSSSSSNVVFAAGAEATLAQFFAAVTAPFVEYQRRYGALEEEHAWAAAEALLDQMAPSQAGAGNVSPQAPTQVAAESSATSAPAAASTADASAVAAASSDAAAEPAAVSTSLGPAAPAVGAGAGGATAMDSKQAAVERFEAQVSTVCRFAPEALTCASSMTRRCVVFTGGAQAVALVEMLASFLCRFAQRLVLHWKEVLRPAAGLDVSSKHADKQLAKQASKQERQRLKQQAKALSMQAAGAAIADGTTTTDPTAATLASASTSASSSSASDPHNKNDDLTAATTAPIATTAAAAGPAWDWRYLQSALRLLAFSAEWARGVASAEAETAAALAALYQPLFQPTTSTPSAVMAPSSLSTSASATNSSGGHSLEMSGKGSSPPSPASAAAHAPGLMAVLAGPLEGQTPSATPGSAFAPQQLAAALALERERTSSSSGGGGNNGDDNDDDDDDVGRSGVSMGDLLLDDKSSSSSSGGSASTGGRASAASWEACGRVEALSLVCGRRAIAQQLNPPEAKALKQLLLRAAHGDKLQMVRPSSTTPTTIISGSGSSGGAIDPLAVGSGLLAGARRDALSVCAAARALVLDLGLKVVRSSLSPMAQLDLWEGKPEPAYSVQPSAPMTAIGEHLLSLYQELELFAHSSSRNDVELADALLDGAPPTPLPGGGGGGGAAVAAASSSSGSGASSSSSSGQTGPLLRAAEGEWRRLALLLPLSDAETAAALPQLATGKAPMGFSPLPGEEASAHNEDDDDEDDEGNEDPDENPEDRAAAKFCGSWLNAFARHVVALWLYSLLSVPSVDACGAKQLAADLSYLLNVFAALGLRRHAVLVHVLKLCELDKEAFATALRRPKQQPPTTTTASIGGDGTDALSCAVLRKLERHLASCRGVSMVFGDDEELA